MIRNWNFSKAIINCCFQALNSSRTLPYQPQWSARRAKLIFWCYTCTFFLRNNNFEYWFFIKQVIYPYQFVGTHTIPVLFAIVFNLWSQIKNKFRVFCRKLPQLQMCNINIGQMYIFKWMCEVTTDKIHFGFMAHIVGNCLSTSRFEFFPQHLKL